MSMDEDSGGGFNQLPGVPAPHQKVGMDAEGGAMGPEGMGAERQFASYEPGPPLSYMERIAEKRQLEEVSCYEQCLW